MILEEIDHLPQEKQGEVLDFIKFLETKTERDNLTRSSQRLSEESFRKIWDNEEDSIYDAL